MHVVELRPGEQQAERAEEPGERGHEHRAAAELLREARPRAPARRRRRRSARTRAGRGPSPTTPTAARASSARSRARGSRRRPRAASAPSGSATALDAPARPARGEIVICAVRDRARRHQAEHDVRVGHGRRPRRRGRSRPAPARRPRCAARPAARPPRRARRSSRRRRRPRRCRSSGSAAARPRRASGALPAESEPPTSYSRPRETAPPSISDAFAVVPPMSNEIAFAKPSRCATPSAATTPAAGPDSSASTGRRPASSAVITPPEDCMIVSGASIPARVEPAADAGRRSAPSAAARTR